MRKGALLAALLLALAALAGCSNIMDGESYRDVKLASASTYPVYAVAVNILDGVGALELDMLAQPMDGCPRSYSISDWDVAAIVSKDLIIIAGRGFESYESALMSMTGGPIVISALSGAKLLTFGEETANDESSHLDGENPWTFLSVAGAMDMAAGIAHSMAEVDPLYADIYMSNLAAYDERLERLVSDMSAALLRAPRRKVAILHEGLEYFARQFALDVALNYPREPGADMTDNELSELFEALTSAGVEVVMLERQAPDSLKNALRGAGYALAALDTMTTHPADGDTRAYERLMLENASILAKALEGA